MDQDRRGARGATGDGVNYDMNGGLTHKGAQVTDQYEWESRDNLESGR